MTDNAKALADHIRSDLTYITGLADHMEAGGDVSKKNIGDLIAIVRWNAEHHLECRDTIETQAREIERLNAILSEMNDTDVIARTMAENERLRGIVRGLIALVIDAGLTDDLVAQLYPDAKRKNGQPACEFAKRVRREVNEARAEVVGEIVAWLEEMYENCESIDGMLTRMDSKDELANMMQAKFGGRDGNE